MTPELKKLLANEWLLRAKAEHAASAAFEHVHARVLERGASAEVCELAMRAVADELRHSALCRQVAARYGADLAAEPLATHAAPSMVSFADVPPGVRQDLRVLVDCCVQETLACAYLEHCYVRAVVETPRTALRSLLADEIGHARIGWAHLTALPKTERAAMKPALERVVGQCAASWHARIERARTIDAPEHGVPNAAELHAVIARAIDELVVPGFAAHGVVLDVSVASGS